MPRRHLHGTTPWNAICEGAASFDETNRVGHLMRKTKTTARRLFGATAASTLALSAASLAYAQEMKAFDIEAQPLSSALIEYSEQSDTNVIVPGDLVDGKSAPALSGQMESDEALEKLLDGSGLKYEADTDGSVMIMLASAQQTRARNNSFRLAQTTSAPAARSVRTDDAPAEMQADTIIVTASRREQNLQDAPMSVSVLQPELFVDAGLSSIQDVISYTPGFSFNTSGSGGQTVGRPKGSGSISARGIGQEGFGNISQGVVGVYVDDVQIGNGTISFDGLLADIERIELLKGPQGTLYGATSVGGAIRYVTQKPSLDDVTGRLAADLSHTEEGDLNQIYSGRVSLPIVEDRLGLTVGGYWEDNGGFTDRVGLDGVVTKENADEYESFGVFGDILLKANDRLEFRGRVLHQELEFDDASFISLVRRGRWCDARSPFRRFRTRRRRRSPAHNEKQSLCRNAGVRFRLGDADIDHKLRKIRTRPWY